MRVASGGDGAAEATLIAPPRRNTFQAKDSRALASKGAPVARPPLEGMMLGRTAIAALLVGLALSGSASAHDDGTPDATRCDRWVRSGHTGGHEHNHDSDIPLGDPANTEIHSVGGHHGVRNDYGYVEVVGGSGYRGPDPSGNTFPGQGGFVQAEVDPGVGGVDADANVAVFGPNLDDLPTDGAVVEWLTGSYGSACVNVAGLQVSRQTRTP